MINKIYIFSVPSNFEYFEKNRITVLITASVLITAVFFFQFYESMRSLYIKNIINIKLRPLCKYKHNCMRYVLYL